MGKKLYVGNLAFSVNNESLLEKFSEFGEVASAKVIMDRDSGRSKGFGFVEMSNSEDADKAIETLDGNEWQGRPLKVNEAKPQEDRGGGRRQGGRSQSWRY